MVSRPPQFVSPNVVTDHQRRNIMPTVRYENTTDDHNQTSTLYKPHHQHHHQPHPQHDNTNEQDQSLLLATSPPQQRLLTSTTTSTPPPNLQTPQEEQQQTIHKIHPQPSHRSVYDYGLLITLETRLGSISSDKASPSSSSLPPNQMKSLLTLQFCKDHNLRHIHPNSYAPANLENVQKLGGGGSGVAVFGGYHPRLGNIVMKHGSDKDLVELFALATVTKELQHRGSSTTTTTTTTKVKSSSSSSCPPTTTTTVQGGGGDAQDDTNFKNDDDDDEQAAAAARAAAARHLQQRIPCFRMIYISPHHLGENRKELWQQLRTLRGVTGEDDLLLPFEEEEEEEVEDSSTNDDTTGGMGDDSSTSASASASTSTSTTALFYFDPDDSATDENSGHQNSCNNDNNNNNNNNSNNNHHHREQQNKETLTPILGGEDRSTTPPNLRQSKSQKSVTIVEDQPVFAKDDTKDGPHQDDCDEHDCEDEEEEEEEEEEEVEEFEAEENFRMLKTFSKKTLFTKGDDKQQHPGVEISKSGTVSGHRNIAVVVVDPHGDSQKQQQQQDAKKKKKQKSKKKNRVERCSISLIGDTLTVSLPEGKYHCHNETTNHQDDHKKKKKKKHNNSYNTTSLIQLEGDGYEALQAIYHDLLVLMKYHRWKFTLGQKRIGGEHLSQTGNLWLYHDKLNGQLLDFLITQKIQLVRDLVNLTTSNEQDPSVVEDIRKEVQVLKHKTKEAVAAATNGSSKKNTTIVVEAGDLSEQADGFVGNAIVKNFRTKTGRFPILIKVGERFRDHCQQQYFNFFLHFGSPTAGTSSATTPTSSTSRFIITPEEDIPAYHLGCLTQRGALLGDTFENAPMEPIILESMDDPEYWLSLLELAVRETGVEQQPQLHKEQQQDNEQHHNHHSHLGHHRRMVSSMPISTSMATKRLWTCGLADAGLHNLFLSPDRLWLFDLGEPQLTSVPGFLTKFLFSFFHTLGMQERSDISEDEGSSDSWVRRFEPNLKTNKLRPTNETSRLLHEAYSAFELSLNRIVNELFDGDDSVRWLLLQYVTLQLLSDASFCLQKWTTKGGGRARDLNHQEGIEKWLWRSLWDIYVACDINSQRSMWQFKVQPDPTSTAKVDNEYSHQHEMSLKDRHLALIQELSLENFAW